MSAETPVNSRHRARQVAVQALYWLHSQPWDALADVVRSVSEENNLGAEGREHALMLCRRAEEGRGAYEQAIASVSENWDADRIGRLEHIIIRVALAEWDLRQADAPPKVVLDEAVNLAREFCGDDAGRFVNGLLDRIGREKGILGRRPAT